MHSDDINNKYPALKINQQESKLALCVFSHLRNLFCTVGLDRGGIMGPLDMDQADLLMCSASLRALIFDDDAPEPPLFSMLKKFAQGSLIPCLEMNVNMFFMSDYFGERPHVSDVITKILCETFMTKEYGLEKIDQDDAFFAAYLSGRGFESLLHQAEKWIPTFNEMPESGVGISGTIEGPSVSQLVQFKRKKLPFWEWRNSRIGYLKNIPVKRHDVIRYTANKLGGVHYDSKRLPPKNDRKLFHLLSEAYDWDDQSIVHAGLVCAAIMSIEIVLCPEVAILYRAIPEFLIKRDRRLRRRLDDCEQDWL